MSQALKDSLLQNIKSATHLYKSDLEAMSHELLSTCPGGSARCAYDYTYEIVIVNDRIAARLKGQDPGPWAGPEDDFVTAPDSFKDKETAISKLVGAAEAVAEALQAVEADDIPKKFEIDGRETSFLDLAGLASVHMMYHCGQLNLVQAMDGDKEVHWGPPE